MHFVGAVGDAQGAGAGVGVAEEAVVAQTGTAVDLDGPVDDLTGHARYHDLDHGHPVASAAGALLVEGLRGGQRQQPGLLDLAAAEGDGLLGHAVASDGLAEDDARLGAIDHGLQGAFGQADQAHAMVHASRSQTTLGDLEALALAVDQMAERHPRVLEGDFGMTIGGVVETEQLQRPNDAHAGGIPRHDHHRVARVRLGLGIGLAHDNEEFAARIHGAGGPPFAPADAVVIAVAEDAAADVGGVRRSDIGFGHGEAGADLAGQQRFQPLPLLEFVAVQMQYFHVAGIGCRAVEDLRSNQRTAHDLGHAGVIEIAQAGAVAAVGQEQIPQSGGPGLALHLLHGRGNLPALPWLGDGGQVFALSRFHYLAHEAQQTFVDFPGAGGQIEHASLLDQAQAVSLSAQSPSLRGQGVRNFAAFSQSLRPGGDRCPTQAAILGRQSHGSGTWRRQRRANDWSGLRWNCAAAISIERWN